MQLDQQQILFLNDLRQRMHLDVDTSINALILSGGGNAYGPNRPGGVRGPGNWQQPQTQMPAVRPQGSSSRNRKRSTAARTAARTT